MEIYSLIMGINTYKKWKFLIQKTLDIELDVLSL